MIEALRELPPDVARAIWAGDVDWLFDHYPCRCCCWEHTFGPGCPAYAWGGCRGQNTMTREDEQSWARHYATYHGMTERQFYGWDDEPC
jgi:hypothetical protein